MIGSTNFAYDAGNLQRAQLTRDQRIALETAVIQKHGWIENLDLYSDRELEEMLAQPSKREAM